MNRIFRFNQKFSIRIPFLITFIVLPLISLSILSSIFYVILNSLSIWLIGTMLGNIMMGNSKKIENPSSMNEHLNYFIENMIGEGTTIDQLKGLCIILISIFIIKNILSTKARLQKILKKKKVKRTIPYPFLCST